MYRDMFAWAEKELGVEKERIHSLRIYSIQNHCSDIQTLIKNNICTREQMIKAIKREYLLDTYTQSIESIKPIKDIPVYETIDDGYMLIKNPANINETWILITKPTSKMSITEKVKRFGLTGKTRMLFIFDDDIKSWKQLNQTKINNQKLNSVASIISETKESEDKYEIDDEETNEESVVGIINKIIIEAVNQEASDIHIEPFEKNIKIRYRINGTLKDDVILDNKSIHKMLVNRVKVMANMDTNNRNTPQSGKINIEMYGKDVDMRISTLPTIYGEKITIRILVSQNVKIRSLEELGFNAEMCNQIRDMSSKPHGIILVSGPTGSGKTSTLASVLNEVTNTEVNTVTIEDPVEYRIPGVNQVNISEAQGLTFASALREILRQDPDIIMVGEIRDVETARIAVTASNTGHLVFSTVHTNNAVSAITRLNDMGVEPYMLADSLIGVISQRLVKKLCPDCRRDYEIDDFDITKYKLPEELRGEKAYRPCGCSKCKNGFIGRIVVPEILVVDKQIREAIHDKAYTSKIEELAKSNGMKSQLQYAYKLMLSGETTAKEIYRVLGGVDNG